MKFGTIMIHAQPLTIPWNTRWRKKYFNGWWIIGRL